MSPALSVAMVITGVKAKQIISFVSSAESPPEASIINKKESPWSISEFSNLQGNPCVKKNTEPELGGDDH
ncbi:MAG: hypothetical protein ACK415_12815 [Thermodesulfovibrionales bacterium]